MSASSPRPPYPPPARARRLVRNGALRADSLRAGQDEAGPATGGPVAMSTQHLLDPAAGRSGPPRATIAYCLCLRYRRVAHADRAFRKWNMCSAREDLTTRAVIRDEALRLFAEYGPEAVSLRRVAAAAGASPGLVAHHFGSKAGLREAVEAHVERVFDALFAALDDTDWSAGPSDGSPAGSLAGSLAEVFVSALPPDSPIPVYLRRLLLSGDLAVLLLRDQIAAVLGVDPLGRDGMTRWAGEVLAVYQGGLFVTGQMEQGERRR